MARRPDDEIDPSSGAAHDGDSALDDLDDLDEEAVVDQLDPTPALADASGLGVDLPEADALDQRNEVPLDDEEDY